MTKVWIYLILQSPLHFSWVYKIYICYTGTRSLLFRFMEVKYPWIFVGHPKLKSLTNLLFRIEILYHWPLLWVKFTYIQNPQSQQGSRANHIIAWDQLLPALSQHQKTINRAENKQRNLKNSNYKKKCYGFVERLLVLITILSHICLRFYLSNFVVMAIFKRISRIL